MEGCSRWGEKECERMEIFLGSHHFLLIMKHTLPPLDLPASAVLSIRKKEKLSDGVKAVSETKSVSHVSAKKSMLQSLMSRWKLILALRSSKKRAESGGRTHSPLRSGARGGSGFLWRLRPSDPILVYFYYMK